MSYAAKYRRHLYSTESHHNKRRAVEAAFEESIIKEGLKMGIPYGPTACLRGISVENLGIKWCNMRTR